MLRHIICTLILLPLLTFSPCSDPAFAEIAILSQRVLEVPFERIEMPSLSPDGSRVVFSGAAADGRNHLFVMPTDGGEPTALTYGDGNDWSARWSPDGGRIAFVSDRSGNREIWVVPASGGEAKKVTSDPGDDLDPEWSPDGSRIAFSSRRGGPLLLYVALLSDLSVYPLSAGAGPDRRPAWSPDGRWIAFQSSREKRSQIWLMPADGGEARRVSSNDSAEEAWPAWLPDSSTLMIHSSAPDTPPRLWLVPIESDRLPTPLAIAPIPGADPATGAPPPALSRDGSRLVAVGGGRATLEVLPITGGTPATVLTSDGRLSHPSWTRNGRQLVLASDLSGEWELWLAGISSGRLTRLTTDESRQKDPAAAPLSDDVVFTIEEGGGSAIYLLEPQTKRTIRLSSSTSSSPARDAEPAWSPDGRQIAFSSERNGNRDLYVVGSGGGEAKRLTSWPGSERHPSWSPDGSWLVFARDTGSGSTIWKVRVAGGEPVAITRGAEVAEGAAASGGDHQPVWSPSGKWIAFMRRSGGAGIGSSIYIIPPDGGKPFPFRRGGDEVRVADPAWSPDGAHLAWTFSRIDRLVVHELGEPGSTPPSLVMPNHPGTPEGQRQRSTPKSPTSE